MLEAAELLHTTSSLGPINSSMTYLTWAATARFYGSHDDLLLYFRSAIWLWSFCCQNIFAAAGKVSELVALVVVTSKGAFVSDQQMEMVAEGREGSCERRHPRHLAAEGHAPVCLHAFSTGLSSDSLLVSLTLTYTHAHAHTYTDSCRYSDSHSRDTETDLLIVRCTVTSINNPLLLQQEKTQDVLLIII